MKKSTVLIVLMHIVYWFPTLMRLYYPRTYGGGDDFAFITLSNHLAILLSVFIFYFFYFYLFPRFLYKPQLLEFTAWGSLSIVVAVGIGYLLVTILVRYSYSPVVIKNFLSTDLRYMTPMIARQVLGAAVGACIMKGFITWFTEIHYKEQLERQNVATNLELLKAKINPHFLFNTLNNIDILIEKDAPTASVYLKKLSDILRFTLYESPSATIELKKEISYIQQYIELQKIRTSNEDFVMFECSKIDYDIQIAPMLFIPFIENAFKYSTNKKISNAIVISISADSKSVNFNCSNVYDDYENITGEGGLGLTIMRERLQLLYPDSHYLEITKKGERFTVNLTITLHDN